jgi:hypothetical protein
MISHKELNASQISHVDEFRKDLTQNPNQNKGTNLIDKEANVLENNLFEENKSNHCSRKTCSNEDYSSKNTQSNLEDMDCPIENYNSENKGNSQYLDSLKHVNLNVLF